MAGEYWNEHGVRRQRLLWAIATRRQLERWEPLVAKAVQRGQLDDVDIWAGETEYHFVLIAVRNLFHALDLDPPPNVEVDPTLRSELIESRDLHEHWKENAPIFNVTPLPAEPSYRSGKEFAARNPDTSPYWWFRWSPATGARLLPNVPASAVHDLVDVIEADVCSQDADFRRFVPPRAHSPWHHQNGEWWPLPPDGDE
jgi:hypothetical protein